MKIRKLVNWFIVLIVCFFVVKKIVQVIISFNEDDFYSESLINEYKNLFPKNEKDKLTVVWNYNSKVRNQISLFDYGSDKKYSITVYKIPMDFKFSLKQIKVEKSKEEKMSSGSIYNKINEGLLFEINYISGKPVEAKTIKFTYSGDTLRNIVENDSIKAYNLNFETFSIKYNNEKTVDIYGETSKFWNKSLAMNIIFLKRNDALYLLIMTINNNNDILPPDLLYNLITEKASNDPKIK